MMRKKLQVLEPPLNIARDLYSSEEDKPGPRIHTKACIIHFLNSNYVYDNDIHRRTLSGGEVIFEKNRIKHLASVTQTTYKKSGDTHLQGNDFLLMRKRAQIDVTEFNYRNEIKLENHQLTTGIGHRREDFYGNAFNYNNRSRYLPEYSWIYLVNQWAVSDRLVIVPSLRQERINYFEDRLLGQFGATLFLDDKSEQI